MHLVEEAPFDIRVMVAYELPDDLANLNCKKNLGERNAKTLSIVSEYIAEVNYLRFCNKFIRKFWNSVVRLSAINPTYGALVIDLYFVFFSFLVRMYGTSGPRWSYYYRPKLTEFINNNHPKTNVYSITNNKGTCEQQENVLHLPAFFKHYLGEWQPFIKIKKKRKFEKKRYFCAFIVSNIRVHDSRQNDLPVWAVWACKRPLWAGSPPSLESLFRIIQYPASENIEPDPKP